jgi:hypothetical protein
MTKRFRNLLVCLSVCVASCAATVAGNLTPAEKHRLLTQNIDKMCKEVGAGPYEADPRRLVTKRGYTICDDFLKLEPREWKPETFVAVEGQPDKVPPHWLATEEGRFAHSIKLPNPLSKDSGYRPGMSGEEYFKLLCDRESGEFIYRSAKDVEGIFLMRPRPRFTDEENAHLYFLEDPAEGSPQAAIGPFLYVGLGRYRVVEAVAGEYSGSGIIDRAEGVTRSKYIRIEDLSLPQSSSRHVRLSGMEKASARYAVTWRGLNRYQSRELGIAGSEAIVIDRASMQTIALLRFYSLTGNLTNKVNWETAPRCDQKLNTAFAFRDFVFRALPPINSANSGSQKGN